MLNHIQLNNFVSSKASVFLIMLSLLTCLNCGKRTPPLPPVERVVQRVEISGFQRGNKVNLNWTMPARNAPDGNTLNIDRVDIYRLVEPSDSTLTLSEEEFASRSTLVSSLKINEDDFRLKKIAYTDNLQFAGQAVRLRYAVRFVNNSGQKAAFSNFLLIEPSAKVAEAPVLLSAELTQSAILLKWDAPQQNVDESKPANISGYNIYRSTSENETAIILNKTIVTDNKFTDDNFQFDKDYFYFVRTISPGNNGERVESLESNIIRIAAKDTFPPASPDSITIAAAPNNLSIFFAANIDNDIAGYRVYRSIDKNLTFSKWENLTPELLTTNTFRDEKVQTSITYFYYLVAVDKAGNISKPSEIISETAP